MKFKYEKEFRKAHPETIGEKDSIFDLVNYTEWLETIVVQKIAVKDLTSNDAKPVLADALLHKF